MKKFLIFLSIFNFLNASEGQIAKYCDSSELQKCDWKTLYKISYVRVFSDLRQKLDTNLTLHTTCDNLMRNDVKLGQLYDQIIMMAIVSKFCELGAKELEYLDFIMPDNFSVAKHPRYIIYSLYLQKFVDSIDKIRFSLMSQFPCSLLIDSNLLGKLDETNLSAFKDLIAAHISLLVGASVPELKKEEPKRE